jgi:hypothetical protein
MNRESPAKNPWQTPASQHLDRLDEKFDFPDPAHTEFYVALLMPRSAISRQSAP